MCLMAWGHRWHSAGMGRSQGVWTCLGRTQGAQTCGHFGATGNLSLLLSHNGPHCVSAPTGFPSVSQPCLSRKKKTCFSGQLRSDLPPTLQWSLQPGKDTFGRASEDHQFRNPLYTLDSNFVFPLQRFQLCLPLRPPRICFF